MKTKHTPGPWKANNVTLNNWKVEAASPHIAGLWQTICEINGPWREDNYAANARLISTAPELLSACQFALEWIKEMKEANPHAIHPKGWVMIELESAIENAIG